MRAVQTAFDFAAPREVAAQLPDVQVIASELGVADDDPGALCRFLEGALAFPVSVEFTDNTRTMLSCRERSGRTHVRLHHMFASAPAEIRATLADYLRSGNKTAARRLSGFVDSQRQRIRKRPTRAAPPRARGRYHDLWAILAELNAQFFGGEVDTLIGWSRMGRPTGRRRSRRSIKLGSYRERDALIRIHPVLDQRWVPALFVRYVVYHEMLHHVLGIGVRAGRRRMHTPEFRRRERALPEYREAIAWEQRNLARLLSS